MRTTSARRISRVAIPFSSTGESLATEYLSIGEVALFDRLTASTLNIDGTSTDELVGLAILGLRHLAMGGKAFDRENAKGEIYWTAQRLVNGEIEKAKKASGRLRDHHKGRAGGMLSAFLQAGMIDNDFYMRSYKAMDEQGGSK